MYDRPGMMMGSLADENNGSLQWRMTCAQKVPVQTHAQIRNGGTRKVTNACSTAVNIQLNRNRRARVASDRNIRRNNTDHRVFSRVEGWSPQKFYVEGMELPILHPKNLRNIKWEIA